MEAWVAVAQSLGVPVACLVGLAFGVWKSLVWLGTKVIEPVAARAIKFMDGLDERLDAFEVRHADMGMKLQDLRGLIIQAPKVVVQAPKNGHESTGT